MRGVPKYLRRDNGAEFTAKVVREAGVKMLFIEPGSPWENGHVKSFNGKLREELLNGEIFYGLREAKVLIEHWWEHYNTVRPHSSLGYRPPASEATLLVGSSRGTKRRRTSPQAASSVGGLT
jgi:transposase InsO family protein